MARWSDPVSFGHGLLENAGIEPGGSNPWDIQIHNDELFARVFRDRELGLGEAYQERWWDVESLDQFLARILVADLRNAIRPSAGLLLLAARAKVANRQSVDKAAKNARAHYDIGNDLYVRMLDKRMAYSCGYWRNAHALDEAQEAKFDLICQKLQLEEGVTLLDIGCGWGGLAQYAASEYGAIVTGISPAGEQVRVARERTAGLPVTIEQLDYRDVQGSYDRIVSVGMMEHIGPKNLRTFFDVCSERLHPEGLMLHHTIGSNESKLHTDPWFDKYIFPGGVVPSLEQITGAALDDWAIEDVHNFGPDYDTTLMAWHRNIEAHWHEIPHYDERFRRTWRYYLLTSAASFRVRNLQLWQVVFSRSSRVSSVYDAVR